MIRIVSFCELLIDKLLNKTVNQLKAGALLNYVVIALNMVVGLIYTPYMLRMMGPNHFSIMDPLREDNFV